VDPVYGEAFASAIGNARLELVDHAGHLPHIEQGGRVLPLVTGFLG
jgi:pimeloyl-ACP methyl ester carboxylesterase